VIYITRSELHALYGGDFTPCMCYKSTGIAC